MGFSGFRHTRRLTLADRAMLADGELANATRRERVRNGYRLMKRPVLPHLAENAARDEAIIRTRGRVLWDESLHPRWPAGTWAGQGGEFRSKNEGDSHAPRNVRSPRGDGAIDDGGDGGFILASADKLPSERPPEEEPPRKDLPESQSETPGFRSARAVVRGLQTIFNRVDVYATLLKYGPWVLDRFGDAVRSYFDDPKSLEELREGLVRRDGRWRCPSGYELHHIVEQGISDAEKKAEEITGKMLQDRSNVICAPIFRHRDLSDWYSTKNSDYLDENGNWLSPREYLRGKGWEYRYQFGIEQLKKFGVLQP